MHIMLPRSCNVGSIGCQTADQTFIWNAPYNECSLEKVRQVVIQEEDGYLVDREAKVLLKKMSKVPSLRTCLVSELFGTEYENLYLALMGLGWLEMKRDLDITTFIEA